MLAERARKRAKWRQAARRRRERLQSRVALILPNRCECCTNTEPFMRLELAHLKPTGLRGRSRGSERQLKDVLANPTCYARLCRACHVEMDAGQLEDVRERLIRKREADLKHIRRLCTILQFARRDLPLALIPDPTGANILFRRIC